MTKQTTIVVIGSLRVKGESVSEYEYNHGKWERMKQKEIDNEVQLSNTVIR